jgi:hypothetical protein
MATPYTTDTTKHAVPTEEVRQGESTGHVRYVLYASLILTVVAGIVLYAIYAG